MVVFWVHMRLVSMAAPLSASMQGQCQWGVWGGLGPPQECCLSSFAPFCTLPKSKHSENTRHTFPASLPLWRNSLLVGATQKRNPGTTSTPMALTIKANMAASLVDVGTGVMHLTKVTTPSTMPWFWHSAMYRHHRSEILKQGNRVGAFMTMHWSAFLIV